MSRTTNAISSGGGGVAFEHLVGADLLSALLSRSGLAALDASFEIEEIQFQSGDPVDDFRVVASHPEAGQLVLHVAARRRPGLRPSDPKFVALVGAMLDQIALDPDAFHRYTSRLGLAVRADTPGVQSMMDLCVVARNATDGDDLRLDVLTPLKYDRTIRQRYEMICGVVEAARPKVPADQRTALVWQLLRACRVMPYRLEVDDDTDRVTAINRLGLVGLTVPDATATYGALETLAETWGPQGSTVNGSRLRRELQPRARVGRSTRTSTGWRLLDQLDIAAGHTEPHIVGPNGAQVELQRTELRSHLRDQLRTCGVHGGTLVVSGDPSTGKSALTLRVARDLADAGDTVMRLNLQHLPGDVLGLNDDFVAIVTALAEAPVSPCRLLVVDGCEAVIDGHADRLTQLFQAAQDAGLGVALIVRDDLLEEVLAATASPDAQRVDVAELSDAELDELAEAIPSLAPSLRSPRSRQLISRVGLAALLVRSATSEATQSALSEAALMRLVWDRLIRRRDGLPSGASPDDRSAIVEAVARSIFGLDADPIPQGMALEQLRVDSIVARPPELAPWADELRFANDAIRDLAAAFLLLKTQFAPLAPTAPKWAIRAARIACQARLEAAEDVSSEMRTLQETFDALASAGGSRWTELPTEALVTVSSPEATLAGAAEWLTHDRTRMRRLLRVLRQRHGQLAGTLDPITATPVMGFLADHLPLIGSRGDLADDSTKALIAWLQGLAVQPTDEPCTTRARYRPLLLVSDHLEDEAIEAIAMLGPDLGSDGRQFLQSLSAQHSERLYGAVESLLAPYSLARHHPDLLLDVARGYYIEPSRETEAWGISGEGVRHIRHGFSIGHPFAAAHYGPFFRALNADPPGALDMIEDILEHALMAADGYDDYTLTIDLPDQGPRTFRGQPASWPWYLGLAMGPHPCMSALMAVEAFASHVVSIGVPPRTTATMLLDHARTMPSLAHAVGFVLRNLETCDDLVLAFLSHPLIWELQTDVAVQKHFGLRAGPHQADEDLPNAGRRYLEMREIAFGLMATALMADDAPRISQLESIGQGLLRNGEIEPVDRHRCNLMASALTRSCYSWVDHNGQRALGYEPPPEEVERLAAGSAAAAEESTVLRLRTTYESNNWNPDDLATDLAAIEAIAEASPTGFMVAEARAMIAAAAIQAQAAGTVHLTDQQAAWALGVIEGEVHVSEDDDQILSTRGDRSAAKVIGHLLLPLWQEQADGSAGLGIERVVTLGQRLATEGSDEVARMLALGLRPVWDEPCGPGPEGSSSCRHHVALSLAEISAQRCFLGPYDVEASSRLANVPLPLALTLDDCAADQLLLTRLSGAISSSVSCSLSSCCAADDARPLAAALVRAHRRVGGHWATSNFQYREWDSEPVASALLRLAEHGDDSLLGTALAFAKNPRALDTLLRDLLCLATYEPVERARMRKVWAQLFEAISEKLLDGSIRSRHWRHWDEGAVAHLIPNPTFRITETNYDSTLASAKVDWPSRATLEGGIDRWLELASGHPRCADELARFLWRDEDVSVGLAWIERLIGDNPSQIANRTGYLHIWLKERSEETLSSGSRATLERVIDLLATAGDDHVSKLQID